jgi:hypothetical protein
MTEECLVEPTYGTASIRKHFVKDPDDYHALCAYIEDSVVIESQDGYNRAVQELGEDGLPLVRVERTPYQQLWIQWVSMEDFAGHLQDVPDRVRSCVDAMAVEQRRVFEIVARSPIPFANFPDNVTAPVIGDANFRTYCLPYYNELAAMLAERGVPVFVHMDGDLRPLWGAISESSIGGIDSLSPPPDNDTSAGDAASQWPEMRIFLNYPSSVHLEAPETIYRHTIGILEEAGRTGRLQIQISENVPPGVWRKSFPQIIRAIRDFPLA